MLSGITDQMAYLKFPIVNDASYRNNSGPEYEWAMKMVQWHMSYSFACKNQYFHGPFEILMGHLEK